ncbi:hypothetical protein COV24_02740 [candidate division WWE3 bacterium CG10_big_fil_rev_8_21_14_0_10_32_10]|uniref:AbiEi antitoxin C-terminal domain-containing protein n=1 Tax=candidate division WWE3 bacterium CG10_big_fil_rev_8_21_14_0_10_32_10 TaxID=1975090 RepID=A0A2H0RA85_UNCKA|nr:MAG: hypothetical protein COV24_02740 [candidate division WWE3 bacterium CG10_big_fil_rev_8_21_14_0_10_32_10]
MVTYESISKLESNKKTFYDSKDLSIFFSISGRKLENTIKKLIDENILTPLERDKYYVDSKKPNEMQIANFLYNPSYISFETALSYYGILSQFPTVITSATTKKTKKKDIQGKEYIYHHLNPNYFTGYIKGSGYLIAIPEKALVDQTYFSLKSIKSLQNLDEYNLTKINKKEVLYYSRLIRGSLGNKITELFMQTL